jgi:hypothetical protein
MMMSFICSFRNKNELFASAADLLQLFASAADLLQLFVSAAELLQLFASAAELLKLFASTADLLQLFVSAAEFLSVRAKQEVEGDSSRVCSSPGALREWLNNRNEYHAWRDAVRAVRTGRNSSSSCARMRKAARHLLLIIHPDKFAMIHPACPRDMSTSLAAEFSSEYDKHKTLCASQ